MYTLDHVSPFGFPLFFRRTQLGGIFTLIFMALAFLVILYMIVVFSLDGYALDYFPIPGLANFSPNGEAQGVKFKLLARLIDNPRSCELICNTQKYITWNPALLTVKKTKCEFQNKTSDCYYECDLSPPEKKTLL